MRKVAVIGVGQTKFGQLFKEDIVSLAVKAGVASVRDAGIHQRDIQALYLGSMSGGLFSNQEHLSSLIADHTGFKNIPAVKVESACASGGLAFRQAYIDVASGMHDIVVAGGAEKMTDLSSSTVTKILATAADMDREGVFGATFPGLYAMLARYHMEKYGTTEKQLALVSVKNHKNAMDNVYAQFRKKFTVEQVLNSTKIADPLKLLDASPISDGAASVILASEKTAKKLCKHPVWIKGTGHATDTISLHDRKDLGELKATKEAAGQAYRQAGISADDIDMAEVHDCFTIAEILAIEDLGFVKKGQGGTFTQEGHTQKDGKIPVNMSGGLKAKGHPIGATGIAQVIDIVKYLRGKKGTGLTHNVGGSGGTAIVHILSSK